MRNNIGDAWSDFVLVASLNKEQLSIPDNTTYDFLFYNDQIYPPIDVLEATQLFDWVPRTAFTQSLPNGNVLTYGAINENYDNYPVNELRVTMTAENRTNVPPDTDPPQLTYVGGGPGGPFTFTVSGSVPVGTVYRIVAFVQSLGTAIVLGEYTSVGGDTVSPRTDSQRHRPVVQGRSKARPSAETGEHRVQSVCRRVAGNHRRGAQRRKNQSDKAVPPLDRSGARGIKRVR